MWRSFDEQRDCSRGSGRFPGALRLLFGLTLTGALANAASRHVVQPKATTDNPSFAVHQLTTPDGVRLAYYVRPGDGTTLVLVPETHGDRTQFQSREFLQPLGKRPLVIVESRGQGRSWPPPDAPQASIERFADDVVAIVRHLALSTWYIGGHSLGGMIALEIGGRRPTGLCGVVALEGWVHHRVQADAFPELDPPTAAERAEMRRQREERYRTQQWSAEQVAALGQIWRKWEGGEASVRRMEVPLLSIWGDRGRNPRPSRVQLRLPDELRVSVRWIAGADHYVTDRPYAEATAREMADFLAAIDRARGQSKLP